MNAYYVLDRHNQELEALQVQRAIEEKKKNPEINVEAIGYATDQQTGTADFVCLAFAVELYVKSVSEVLGEKQRGHNIRQLFEKLPEDVQERIFQIHMPNVYQATLDNYKERMDVISKGFEEFRYFFEHQSLTYHRSFALQMIEAIKILISEERAKKKKSDS